MCTDINVLENDAETIIESPTSTEDMETNENMEETEKMEHDEDCAVDCAEELNIENILDMLENWFPNLRKELQCCAPEMLWLKVKHITGFDIINIMESINKKKCLKRKMSPDSPDEEYTKKHFENM